MIPGGFTGGTDYSTDLDSGLTTTDDSDSSTTSSTSDDSTTTSYSDSGGSFADFRQAEADSGGHDEGYAGATDTDDADADAVVDEVNEAEDIVNTTTQTPEEVVETFSSTQPSAAEDDVAPTTDVTPDQPSNESADGSSSTSSAGFEWESLSKRQKAAGAVVVLALAAGATGS